MQDDPCADAADGPGARYAVRFPADALEVRSAVLGAVSRFGRGLPPESVRALEMALAEALNNVVEHACAGQPAALVDLEVACAPEGLRCVIRDTGAPMPAGGLPDGALPRIGQPPVDLPEGGWGWALMHRVASEFRYSRAGGQNRLEFCIPLRRL